MLTEFQRSWFDVDRVMQPLTGTGAAESSRHGEYCFVNALIEIKGKNSADGKPRFDYVLIPYGVVGQAVSVGTANNRLDGLGQHHNTAGTPCTATTLVTLCTPEWLALKVLGLTERTCRSVP
jgi:hypothetical protein